MGAGNADRGRGVRQGLPMPVFNARGGRCDEEMALSSRDQAVRLLGARAQKRQCFGGREKHEGGRCNNKFV